jgi:hypothetical protein
MNGMLRDERRRPPGAAEALRWIAADARDVARIDHGADRPRVYVQTVARGLRPWQRRLERRRLVALLRRCAIVGITVAGVLQIGALASGSRGPGVWLAPALAAAALALALGLTRRTTAEVAARLLDRDLALGAEVSTALELETSRAGEADRSGLGGLAVAGGRRAVAASLSGARAHLRARHGEVALLATLVAGLAVLLLVPSPRVNNPARLAAAGKAHVRVVPPSARALRAENGLAATADAGPSLQGFRQTPLDAPPLAAVQAGGATRSGGAAAGHSPYGGGIANDAATGSVQPPSQTVGQSGAVQGTQDAGSGSSSSSSATEGSGSLSNGSAGAGAQNPTAGGSGSKGRPGASSVAPVQRGRPTGSAPGGSTPGSASRNGGQSKGGTGSSAPGTAPGRKPGKSAPGGATAGTTSGGQSRGKGVVPQLGGSRSALPLAPGYEAVPGSKGATSEHASSTVGRGGGAGHSGQAIGGRQRQRGRSAVRAPWRRGCGVHRSRRRARLLRLLRPRERKRLVT